jgi:hypothetical protein
VKGPLFRDQRTAIVVGALLTVAGYVCLYDAWEKRGKDKPLFVRPVLPF